VYPAPGHQRFLCSDKQWDYGDSALNPRFRAHLRGKDDGVTTLAPVRDHFPRFADLLDRCGEHRPTARLRPLHGAD
jgi:hypothetical protein